jgi:signal transduction histidine kinase
MHLREFPLGQSFTKLIHVRDRQQALSFFRAALEGDRATTTRTLGISTKDGTLPLFFSSHKASDSIFIVGTPVRPQTETIVPIENSSPVRACSADTNCSSARKESLREINRLQELARNQAELLGIAAHDLRNPLSGIVTASEFLLEDLGTSLYREQAALLNAMHQSSANMLCLIEDVLTVAGIDSGDLKLDKQMTDLFQLVQRVVGQNRIAADRKRISLEVATEEDVPMVSIDVVQFSRVLHSLIDNAIHVSKIGSRIRINLSCTESAVRLSVHDQGPGMPEVKRLTLFPAKQKSRKRRSDAPKTKTTLRLVIANRVVKGHGGSISIESHAGDGSTFMVSLPIASQKVEKRSVESAVGNVLKQRAAV